MNGIIVDIQPQALRTSFTPIDSQFGITVLGGGSPTQFYYTNENQYIPNRVLVPMKLKPSLFVVDPDGVLGNGDKSSALAVKWYENSVNTPIVSNSNYTVNMDGSLTISKNVPVSTPIQIICSATFNDTRSGLPIIFEDRITLNSIAKSDEKVTVAIDKDVVAHFNPITDQPMIDIKATVYLGSKAAPVGGCYYEWYKMVGGEATFLDNASNIEYVSGKNADTLRINAENVDLGLYRCFVAYSAVSKPTAIDYYTIYAETTIKRALPHPLRAEIYSPMGQVISPGMESMAFTCRVSTNTKEIANIDKYMSVFWYKKSTAAGATAVQVGHGASITLPVSELKTMGGVQMQVYPEVSDHGAYQILTDKDNNYLTDKDNNILIGY